MGTAGWAWASAAMAQTAIKRSEPPKRLAIPGTSVAWNAVASTIRGQSLEVEWSILMVKLEIRPHADHPGVCG
jgi:hypothetical protein